MDAALIEPADRLEKMQQGPAEYYKEREKPGDHDEEKIAKWQEEMERVHNRAEIIIGKQRHGPIGTVELAFDGRYFGKPLRGSDVKIEIRLKIDAGEVNVIDVLELDKPHDWLERIGLSLDEAKDLLGRLQERIFAAQA